MYIFSVFDSKAEKYLPPFFSDTSASATRALVNVMHDPNHEFTKFAEDYALFEIGYWNQETGEVVPKLNGPTNIVGCWTLKAALVNGNGDGR